ncbi:flagellar hook capping protein [Paenibacillus sp. IB182496]|uniref:Flagellar hook capping protein n=1 Tax=Paenibacillus sabuli TaxID=2772509 RepID=A0A927BTK5_9BACL|nr:flagellar hook capping FlgD N-terminal domain-containing protein [Paenibacillus sabuli]MBD2845284.1 flagellar hook capping protein [Paenibacillus sabuli]
MASTSIGTNAVWPNYHSSNVLKTAEKTNSDTLGKDDFLKILVTQLRYQDPMQPLQDREFIAQMAQFTSVEQLMNMASEMTLMRQNLGTASSMIGKTIQWMELNESTGQTVMKSGVVDSIVVSEGVQYATVGETAIPVEDIISIAEAAPEGDGDEETSPVEEPSEDDGVDDGGAEDDDGAVENG